MSVRVRAAAPGDAEAIAAIHNQGVADRVATLRTEPREADDVLAAIAAARPLLVAEFADGKVKGWASVGPYDDRSQWYSGVGEATVYIAREARGSGIGRLLLAALEASAYQTGYFKLIAKVFDTNAASLRLFGGAEWDEVGTHRRHGLLDGEWKDVVVFEKFLPGTT
ncbi:MAG: N-acetyltransferase family protein [Actinomycetota bacterium]|nr:N-acetyltransferase family protein [Actinomycetota bacterium]